jgi:sec-independent protein translocase protein TatB
MQLANLGMADSFILMVLALVVFGPRRLPQIGRQIGKLMFEFRKASNDFKFQMEEELRAAEDSERRLKEEAERHRVAALAAESQASVSAPAQTVEASADIGAVEPATASTYPEQYPAEEAAASAESVGASEPAPDAAAAVAGSAAAAPVIQPPQTGEQVSASLPLMEQAMAEINPEADAAANAEEFAAAPSGAKDPAPNNEIPSPTPPKETVSQHG